LLCILTIEDYFAHTMTPTRYSLGGSSIDAIVCASVTVRAVTESCVPRPRKRFPVGYEFYNTWINTDVNGFLADCAYYWMRVSREVCMTSEIVRLVREMGWAGATEEEVMEMLPLAIPGPGRWLSDSDLELWDWQVVVAWRVTRLRAA
jgi:hypothetical protein